LTHEVSYSLTYVEKIFHSYFFKSLQ